MQSPLVPKKHFSSTTCSTVQPHETLFTHLGKWDLISWSCTLTVYEPIPRIKSKFQTRPSKSYQTKENTHDFWNLVELYFSRKKKRKMKFLPCYSWLGNGINLFMSLFPFFKAHLFCFWPPTQNSEQFIKIPVLTFSLHLFLFSCFIEQKCIRMLKSWLI